MYCRAGVASAAHHSQAQHTHLHISLSNTTVTKSYPCRITARASCTCATLKRHPCPVATNYDAGNANDATLEYKQQRQGPDLAGAPPVRYILQHAHRGRDGPAAATAAAALLPSDTAAAAATNRRQTGSRALRRHAPTPRRPLDIHSPCNNC